MQQDYFLFHVIFSTSAIFIVYYCRRHEMNCGQHSETEQTNMSGDVHGKMSYTPIKSSKKFGTCQHGLTHFGTRGCVRNVTTMLVRPERYTVTPKCADRLATRQTETTSLAAVTLHSCRQCERSPVQRCRSSTTCCRALDNVRYTQRSSSITPSDRSLRSVYIFFSSPLFLSSDFFAHTDLAESPVTWHVTVGPVGGLA